MHQTEEFVPGQEGSDEHYKGENRTSYVGDGNHEGDKDGGDGQAAGELCLSQAIPKGSSIIAL